MKKERVKTIKSHIETGDYFGTLATILDLYRQQLEAGTGVDLEKLKSIKNDLLYLQNNYKIIIK